MYGNKRPRGDDWGSAQGGRGYAGGGSWAGDQMYGGMDQVPRHFGPGPAGAVGAGGMMPSNGGAGSGMMGGGAGSMAGGMAGGMSGGMSAAMGGGMGNGMSGMAGAGGGGMAGAGGMSAGAGMLAHQGGGMGMGSGGMMQPGSGGGGGGRSMGGGIGGAMMGGGGYQMMGGGAATGGMGGSQMGMSSGMSPGMAGMGGGMGGSMMGGGMGGGMMGGGMQPQFAGGAGGMMGNDGGMGAFPVVKLRGLPFGVREDEVRAFLGCEAVDVLLTRKGGRPSGEAFVVLASTFQLEAALGRNKSYLGRRYVEVFKSHKHEYYSAVTQYMMDGGDSSLQQQYGGGGGGGGSQMYDSRSDRDRDRDRGDNRRRDRDRDAPPRASMQQPPMAGDQPAQHTGMLKLRGLPFDCTRQDIIDWFSDLPVAPIAPDGVKITVTRDGRPSGMAFVEFASPEDAATAMSKDRKNLGTRYVELFPSSRDEADREPGR